MTASNGGRPAILGAYSALNLTDEVDIQNFVEADCGADAWAIIRGRLVAMRDNGDGTMRVLRRYDIATKPLNIIGGES